MGAAKDLAEAACKVSIVVAGGVAPRNLDLPALFKYTLQTTGTDRTDGEVSLSLSAVVQRLAQTRNEVGTGHGRASQPDVSARRARAAAAAATGIVLFLLS